MNFLENLAERYLDLSIGHRKFEVNTQDKKLKKGVEIENEETAKGQYVKHKYKVERIDKEKGEFSMFSKHSKVTGKFLCFPYKKEFGTTVDFNVLENGNETDVNSKLTLHFKSKVDVFMAKLLGTDKIWRNHFEEELTNASKIINKA